MKPAPFEYVRPSSIEEACAALAADPDARLIAGGQTLVPMMAMRLARPSKLVDIARIAALGGIREEAGALVLGAVMRQVEAERSALVARRLPLLALALPWVGHAPTRTRGTICGSIANADPAADYPAAVLGLDAVVETTARKIAADQFFTGLFSTALEPGEVITSVRFKAPDKAGYLKLRHPASGFAVVGVMVAKYGASVRVAVTGAGPSVFRVPAMEKALAQSFKATAIEGIKVPEDDLMSDIHFSAAYRANAVGVLARRAVAAIE